MTQDTPYTVLVIAEAKPGKEKLLHDLLQSLIAPSLKEDGCLKYDLHQCVDNPAKFMFHENWASKAAHAKHREMPHIKAWHAKKEGLLAKPYEVTFWEIIK